MPPCSRGVIVERFELWRVAPDWGRHQPLEREDPIITVLRLVDEIEGNDHDELVRRFKAAHPDLTRQDFLNACTVALDIIDSRPKHLH